MDNLAGLPGLRSDEIMGRMEWPYPGKFFAKMIFVRLHGISCGPANINHS